METDTIVYAEKNATVKVECIFSEDKTVAQLILELVKKQYEG